MCSCRCWSNQLGMHSNYRAIDLFEIQDLVHQTSGAINSSDAYIYISCVSHAGFWPAPPYLPQNSSACILSRSILSLSPRNSTFSINIRVCNRWGQRALLRLHTRQSLWQLPIHHRQKKNRLAAELDTWYHSHLIQTLHRRRLTDAGHANAARGQWLQLSCMAAAPRIPGSQPSQASSQKRAAKMSHHLHGCGALLPRLAVHTWE